MGIFNDNKLNPHSTNSSVNTKGPPGPAGIGYKLTEDGNFDIENKQLKKYEKWY